MLKRSKPYKHDTPINTLYRIRSILREIGLLTYESNYNVDNKLFSSRVQIEDLFNIGTNGKGISISYSLASAYGELMERIQSNILFANYVKYANRYSVSMKQENDLATKLKAENLVLEYEYSFDEKRSSLGEFIENNESLLCLFNVDNVEEFRIKNRNKIENDICLVPFYSITDNTIKYLPIFHILNLCTSNGMCAGNKDEEAIIQGICEIFERYAIKEIYENTLSLPSIDKKVFKGTPIIEVIEYLESKNYYVIIKDCSVGKRLPVIGVLLIDYANNTYCFHLGSDPSPITAIERCFTEIFQNSTNNFSFKPLHYNCSPFNSEKHKRDNFIKTVTTGSGYWPESIFSEAKETFNDFNYWGSTSDEEDLTYLINLIHDLGFEIFIRNNSTFDFPTFHVYIKGMSELFNLFNEHFIESTYGLSNALYSLINVKNLNGNELKELYEYFEDLYKKATIDFDRITLKKIFPHLNADFEIEHFLIVMAIYYENYNKAVQYISDLIQKRNYLGDRNKFLYFFALEDFCKLKCEYVEYSFLESQLSKYYGFKLANIVIEQFSNKESTLKQIMIGYCFSCNKCNVSNSCTFIKVVSIVKKIQTRQKERNIKQCYR